MLETLLLALGLCTVMTFVIVGSLYHDPFIWQNDLPESIKIILPPVSQNTRLHKAFWGTLMFVGLSAFITGCIALTETPSDAGLCALWGFQVFNLYDAIVIDIGLIVWWAPPWAVPPEIRGHEALHDVRWHFTNWLKGAFGGCLFGLLVFGIALLF